MSKNTKDPKMIKALQQIDDAVNMAESARYLQDYDRKQAGKPREEVLLPASVQHQSNIAKYKEKGIVGNSSSSDLDLDDDIDLERSSLPPLSESLGSSRAQSRRSSDALSQVSQKDLKDLSGINLEDASKKDASNPATPTSQTNPLMKAKDGRFSGDDSSSRG